MSLLTAVCFAVALILSFYEFAAVFRARVKNRTKNTSRVILRGSVFILMVVLLWQQLEWSAYVASLPLPDLEHFRVRNIPYLVGNVVLGLNCSLLLVEMLRHARARRKGMTQNRSRLVTGAIMIIAMLPILIGTQQMWNVYVNKVAGSYSRPVTPSAGSRATP